MLHWNTVGRRQYHSNSPGDTRDTQAQIGTEINVHNTNNTNQHQQQQQKQQKQKHQTTLLHFTQSTQTSTTINPTIPARQKRQREEEDPTNEAWGDPMTTKADNCYRICFENINGLGFDVHHNIKEDRFITWARENEVDAMGWAELNINWRMATPSEKLRERLRPGR